MSVCRNVVDSVGAGEIGAWMSRMKTCQFLVAKWLAKARPMPDEPPVTMATPTGSDGIVVVTYQIQFVKSSGRSCQYCENSISAELSETLKLVVYPAFGGGRGEEGIVGNSLTSEGYR